MRHEQIHAAAPVQVEKAGGFSRSDSLCVSGLDVKIGMHTQSQSPELLCWRR